MSDERPRPCFICATEPRLPGHMVCAGCHDQDRCGRCKGEIALLPHPEHEHRSVPVTGGTRR